MMFKNPDDSGQYQLDSRSDAERIIEEKVVEFIDFTTEIKKRTPESKTVRNRHEGYGFLAEAHQNVIHAAKAVKDSMTDLLNVMSSDDAQAVDKTESIVAALEDLLKSTVEMAAEGKRVSSDLFHESWNPSTDSTDDDGFAEPEED